ncbi:hypothetical protein BGX38DRAFT_778826 [Terfezia claveryi]|nr:hypothetical protein BGX38DRAFT_778826 [Terfezia claveryi]
MTMGLSLYIQRMTTMPIWSPISGCHPLWLLYAIRPVADFDVSRSISAKATLIPLPGATNYTKKSNVPSLLGPRDHLYGAPITAGRNLEQQLKKRVSDKPWELTSSNGKRQNTNNRSRTGRGKSFMETHDRGFHDTSQTTLSRTNRYDIPRLKSEQLKEGLAGASTINNMDDIQKEEHFRIPHDHHQAWMQRSQPVRHRMSLDTADSEDENGLDIIGNSIPLTRFRRGRLVLGEKMKVSIGLDSHGKFNVYEGDHEQKEYGFSLDEMNNARDYVHIILNRSHNGIYPHNLLP